VTLIQSRLFKLSFFMLLCCISVLIGTRAATGQGGQTWDQWCAPLVCTGALITDDSMGYLCVFDGSTIQTCRNQVDQSCMWTSPNGVFCYGWIYGTTVSCHLYLKQC
jgi:hypothetical protein